jgi:hypothetical protein
MQEQPGSSPAIINVKGKGRPRAYSQLDKDKAEIVVEKVKTVFEY